jgi:hypothetical protein
MATARMDVARRKTETVTRELSEKLEDGYDVILFLGEDVRPERVLKILSVTAGLWKVDLVIRHAELKEYLEHALTGAAAGAFLGGSSSVIMAIALGNPVSLAAVLSAAGVGAAIGAVLGLASTPCSLVKVYQWQGKTFIKFEQ